MRHSKRYYKHLEDASEIDNEGRKVFRGGTVNLWDTQGSRDGGYNYSHQIYSKVMKVLQAMNSIKVESRGARNAKSEVLLLQEPSEEMFFELDHEDLRDVAGQSFALFKSIVDARIRRISERIPPHLDIQAIIGDFEDRIGTLETQVNGLTYELDKLRGKV